MRKWLAALSVLSILRVALVMLVFAIPSFFVTVFSVSAGAGFGGFSASGVFVVLSAAILSSAAIVAGSTPMGALFGNK